MSEAKSLSTVQLDVSLRFVKLTSYNMTFLTF